MVIKTVSTVGYNNKLTQANQNVKSRFNNDVNIDIKKSGLRLMDGDKPKNDQTNSRPSNPIHQRLLEDLGLK